MLRHWIDRNRASRGKLAALDKVQAIVEFTADGHVRHANTLFLQTMGYRLDEIRGVHHRLFVTPADADSPAYEAFWRGLREGHGDTGLYRRRRKDGGDVWLQSSYNPLTDRHGNVIGVIKYATDVTAQRLTAADMDGRLQAIDRAQATIEFDLDGTILEANDNFLGAMGYTRDEVIGRHHRMFVDPTEASSPGYQTFWARLREGRHDAALYRRLGRDGRVVWIQATYNPIFDFNGVPMKIIKYATDITAQTLAAQTLQREVVSLSGAVVDNADKAGKAEALAGGARHAAERGGAVMRDVVRTMGGIQEGTRSIEEILELIDSLSFQTNLLSLNAAIEAARAGESGKAFAVVAEEVRRLAVRSAEASKQIHQLIGDARGRVDEGASLVGTAGHTMEEILAAIGNVTQVTGAISESAERQSSGIQRVNAAVSQLEAVYGNR
ncbi:PAS domain-containing methyl-accepting chemotaxis protein [Dyella sp. 333MFSha]|uniref:methyl-accepting chemotaxis protein n=1 Tax=Dyella sp. 333MFSha TaxID=1798240 RepID=UPI0008869EEB|nr:PAS domain-containing methyl-accepting chemotaxis protein [Dyella sp. 333MFSha]SDF60778.1 methyl-accepting chemotaxis sensory transducer with Pas/Pac sensor [Dyella sp. 333MFSha]